MASESRWIRVNGVDVEVDDPEPTGNEIKQQGNIPADRVLVRQDLDRNLIVPDDRRFRVADGDVFTHHARHSKA